MVDFEGLSASEVLAHAVEHHHPRLVLACSFQKEDTVLIDMLRGIEPRARVFTIDTGELFPETYDLWRRVEDRYQLHVEAADASSISADPWTEAHCCSGRKVAALGSTLAGVGCLGDRRPPRAVPHPCHRSEGRLGRRPRHLEVQPASGLARRGRLELRAASATCPTTACTTAALPQSAALPAPVPAAPARDAGPDRPRRSAACTSNDAYDWLKKPFSIRRARSSAETSTLRGVSRKTLSAIRCIPPSSA